MESIIQHITFGAEVKRYHTVTTVQNETVGHHSHGVAMLVWVLDPQASRDLLFAALTHDLSEQHTGDIPSPTKRQLKIGEQVERLENMHALAVGLPVPLLSAEDARTLKLADIAHGALFCAREISLGNARMRLVFERYMEYAESMFPEGREARLFNYIRDLM